jgi:large subunit ribosomal protein L22
MEEKIVKVTVKDIAQSPTKLRLVADVVRGMRADKALDSVMLLNKKGSDIVKKALQTGIANAKDLYSVDKDALIVKMISVDESKTLKRAQFGSRGRVSRLNKRRSHLNLELKVK